MFYVFVPDELKTISPNQEIGEGWRRFRLRATNVVTENLFKLLADGLDIWGGSVLPPKPSMRKAFEKFLSQNGYKVTLPLTNGVNPNLPPTGANYRPRKYWEAKTKTLVFWAKVERVK